VRARTILHSSGAAPGGRPFADPCRCTASSTDLEACRAQLKQEASCNAPLLSHNPPTPCQSQSQQQYHSYLPGLTMPAGQIAASTDLEELTDREVEQAYVAAEEERLQAHSHSLLTDMLSIESVLTDAAAAVIDDSFNKCFTSTPSDPWNWNLYLFPMWWVFFEGGGASWGLAAA
jgi:hypothetical protein